MKTILETIGNTPFIRIQGVYAKLETVNPTGSIKDRLAKFIVEKEEKRLNPDSIIVEATSGNTGISFAFVAAVKGYGMTAVMPEHVSLRKRRLIKALGGEIILTPSEEGFRGAVQKTKRIKNENRNVFLPAQFENPLNVEAHRVGIGKEIVEKINNVQAFVAGIGTGGTLMGAGKALKEKFPKLKIIGVEAAEKEHKIEGISDGIAPSILEPYLIDELIRVKSVEAVESSRYLIKKGFLVGISSGANFIASQKVKKKYNFKNVVTVFPDRAERYPELW